MNSTHLLRSPKSGHSLRQPQLLTQSDNLLHETNLLIETPVVSSSIYIKPNQSTPCRQAERHAQSTKRDTIFLDFSNNDVLPALDYALAILEAEDASSVDPDSSTPPQSPTSPTSSVCTSSSPPRYVFSPGPWKGHPTRPPRAHSPPTCHARHPTVATCPLDPEDLAHVFSRTRSSSDSRCVQSIPPSIPFPISPPSPSNTRVPLLQRKPRLGHLTAETISLDMRDPFIFGNSSNFSLVRSLSALDRPRDCVPYKSTTSVNTVESNWSTIFLRRPVLRTPSKFFLSPKKFRTAGTLDRNGSITASLKRPLSNIRSTPSDGDLSDPFRC